MSSTNFVLDGGLPAAQSFQPCHIFGDGDIYGIGVRVSYYITFFSATAALVANLPLLIAQSRLVLTVISLASLINLCVNSTGDNLVILDWMIILALTVFFPVYTIWPPIYHAACMRSARKKSDLEVRLESVKVYHFREVVDLFARIESYEIQIQAHLVLGEVNDQLWADYTGTLSTFYREIHVTVPVEVESVRDRFESWMRAQGVDQDNIDRALEFADNEAIAEIERIKTSNNYRDFIFAESSLHIAAGQLTFACIMLVWSGYLIALPWLFFRGIDRGKKNNCDIRTMEILFIPISVYKRSHVIFLRVAACLLLVFAFFGLIASGWAFWHVASGLRRQLDDQKAVEMKRRHQKSAMRQDALNPTLSTGRIASNTQVSGAGPIVGESGTVTAPNNESDTRDLVTTTSPGAPDRRLEITHSKPFRRELKEIQRVELRKVTNIRRIIYLGPGLISCLAAAISSIVIVELTIHYHNHIDLSRSSITSPSQLYPLLISLFSAVPIFYAVIEKAVFWRLHHEEGFKARSWFLERRSRKEDKAAAKEAQAEETV